jgi:uncharacterized protein YndB with AHSA1/START domain
MSPAAQQQQTRPANSVRKSIVVEAPQERAFRVFTESFDAWWPRDHHIAKAALQAAVLEARAGGRWYEKCVDGSECDWGKVLVWDPPRRLVLAWQITHEWKFDPDFSTEVEVTFTAEGPRRTRVELEHRDLDKFGAAAEEIRKALAGDMGWPVLLEKFAAAASSR